MNLANCELFAKYFAFICMVHQSLLRPKFSCVLYFEHSQVLVVVILECIDFKAQQVFVK